MKNNVSRLPNSNDPDSVLEQAIGDYQDVLIIGYNKNGELDVRANNYYEDGKHILWVLETVKHNLLNGEYSS